MHVIGTTLLLLASTPLNMQLSLTCYSGPAEYRYRYTFRRKWLLKSHWLKNRHFSSHQQKIMRELRFDKSDMDQGALLIGHTPSSGSLLPYCRNLSSILGDCPLELEGGKCRYMTTKVRVHCSSSTWLFFFLFFCSATW